MWTGDVESVPFPFRFGITGRVGADLFDFDYHGQWLLTATRDGMLFAWRLDSSHRMEILPRALVKDWPVRYCEAVVGVSDGFVVIGREQSWRTAAHYNIRRRIVKVHDLGEALDLARGTSSPTKPTLAAIEAITVRKGMHSTRDLPCHDRGTFRLPTTVFEGAPHCKLSPSDGELSLHGTIPRWKPFVPLRDGRAWLKNASLDHACCRGNVLAIRVTDDRGERVLALFRGPDGIPICEFPGKKDLACLPSHDGEVLARQFSGGAVEVRNLSTGTEPILATFKGECSAHNALGLGDGYLTIAAGRQIWHILDWQSSLLVIHKLPFHPRLGDIGRFLGTKFQGRGYPEAAERIERFPKQGYLAARFKAWASNSAITAFLDDFGEVAILDREEKLVCMFFAFRNQLSGWLPDGTCFGPASASRRRPSSQILAKFGAALARASGLASGGRKPPVEGSAPCK
jgi:hypothetical protein